MVGNTLEYLIDIDCENYLGIFNNSALLKNILRFTNHVEMKFTLYQNFKDNENVDFKVYGWTVSNIFDVSLNALV